MSKHYSEDLRERLVAAVEGGLSRRQAADISAVGVSTVIRWVQRFRATGSVAAKPMGWRPPLAATGVRDWILERIETEPDLTIEELRTELKRRGVIVGYGTVWRFFEREAITFKKKRACGRARAA